MNATAIATADKNKDNGIDAEHVKLLHRSNTQIWKEVLTDIPSCH